MQLTSIDEHHDAVTDDHKHAPRVFGDETWTLDHLQAFVIKIPLEPRPKNMVEFDVVALFSNHCFSREVNRPGPPQNPGRFKVKPGEVVEESLIVMDGNIRRVNRIPAACCRTRRQTTKRLQPRPLC